VKEQDSRFNGRSGFEQDSWKVAYIMPMNAILHEADKLYKVSDSLDLLAEEHPPVSDALVLLSGNVRNTATLLRVLVALRMGPIPGLDSEN
jgi:hypothetical protein